MRDAHSFHQPKVSTWLVHSAIIHSEFFFASRQGNRFAMVGAQCFFKMVDISFWN